MKNKIKKFYLSLLKDENELYIINFLNNRYGDSFSSIIIKLTKIDSDF
jgi:hypothetical protein